jgi:ribosomal protein S18 acetylase RimI-like enzyme
VSELAVRDVTPADVGGIRRVAERGWTATYADILSPATVDAALSAWYDHDTTREHVERDDVAYLVAEADEELRGYVSGDPGDETGVATLGALYVSPDHWNEGTGTALLDAFEAVCRQSGSATVRVRVLAANDVGVSFYRARGYEAIGERRTDLFGERVVERVFRGRLE